MLSSLELDTKELSECISMEEEELVVELDTEELEYSIDIYIYQNVYSAEKKMMGVMITQ